jgi:hypothetical protein
MVAAIVEHRQSYLTSRPPLFSKRNMTRRRLSKLALGLAGNSYCAQLTADLAAIRQPVISTRERTSVSRLIRHAFAVL